MTIYFGENIKRLRKEKGLTQEALAEIFGFSFQAISKWERNESYPDITVLPTIATYFNISVDDLLGVDKAKKEEKINSYLEMYENFKLKDTSSLLSEFSKAVKEFPYEYSLLIRFMELLSLEKDNPINNPDYDNISETLVSSYEKIQKHCTDDSIRIWSKRLICHHFFIKYAWSEDKKSLKRTTEIINELPAMADSREYMSVQIPSSDEAKFRQVTENALEELMYLIQNVEFFHSANQTPEEKIAILTHSNELLKALFPQKNYGKNYMHLIYNYGLLGKYYYQTGDKENALKFLKAAAENAVEFDAHPELYEASAKFYNNSKAFYGMNMCTRMTLLMKKHYHLSDEFKSKPQFTQIINQLGNIDVSDIVL